MMPDLVQMPSMQSVPHGPYASGHTNFAELSEISAMVEQLYVPTFTHGGELWLLPGETETKLRLWWLSALALPLTAPPWPHVPRRVGWPEFAEVLHSSQEAAWWAVTCPE